MRMGPGKHLKGLTLAEGLVKPEEVQSNLQRSGTEFDLRAASCSSTISMNLSSIKNMPEAIHVGTMMEAR